VKEVKEFAVDNKEEGLGEEVEGAKEENDFESKERPLLGAGRVPMDDPEELKAMEDEVFVAKETKSRWLQAEGPEWPHLGAGGNQCIKRACGSWFRSYLFLMENFPRLFVI
jgi:hypothetical protein